LVVGLEGGRGKLWVVSVAGKESLELLLRRLLALVLPEARLRDPRAKRCEMFWLGVLRWL
jgi:hypothetical protein